MTCLFLVRHAHSVWTPDEMRPLSQSGLEDARRVADILAPCGRRPSIPVLTCGPSKRWNRWRVCLRCQSRKLRTCGNVPSAKSRRRLASRVEAELGGFFLRLSRRREQRRGTAAGHDRVPGPCGPASRRHYSSRNPRQPAGLLMNHYDPSVDSTDGTSCHHRTYTGWTWTLRAEVQFERMWGSAEC